MRRCVERGFDSVRIDTLASWTVRAVERLPEDLRCKVQVQDYHGIADGFAALP